MLDVLPAASVVVRDPRPLRGIAKSNRENPQSVLGMKCFRQFQRLAFRIFAVSQQHDRPMFIRFGDKRVGGRFDRNAQLRSTFRNRVWPYLIELLPKVVIVIGKRHGLNRFACKSNQPNAVSHHFADHVFDLLLGASQPIGFRVFSQHAPRNVQCKHDLQTFLRNFASRFAPANIHTSQHEQSDPGSQQAC